MKNAHKKAQELLLQYNTRDPWKLANYLGIVVIQIAFKNIHGMYYSIEEHKFAFINSKLDEAQKHRTLLHEIAHALLHPDQNYFALIEDKKIENHLNLKKRLRHSQP